MVPVQHNVDWFPLILSEERWYFTFASIKRFPRRGSAHFSSSSSSSSPSASFYPLTFFTLAYSTDLLGRTPTSSSLPLSFRFISYLLIRFFSICVSYRVKCVSSIMSDKWNTVRKKNQITNKIRAKPWRCLHCDI